jgi:hypothetical protein
MRWHAPVQCRDRILKRNCLFSSFRPGRKKKESKHQWHPSGIKKKGRKTFHMADGSDVYTYRLAIRDQWTAAAQNGRRSKDFDTHTHTRPLNFLQRQI